MRQENHQTPNYNNQIITNTQSPITKRKFGVCNLVIGSYLVFGSWLLGIVSLTGCAGFGKFTEKGELGFGRLTEMPFQEIQAPQQTPRVGEKLTYSVRWMGIEVGQAQLEVRELTELQGRPVYHAVATTRSNRFLSMFYRVNDEIHTYIDAEGLFPRRFVKHQQEGRYRADEEMVYDHEKGIATYRSFLNGSVKQMEIPKGVQDSLSVLYAFRLKPVEIGKSVFLPVNADEKNWNLEVQLLKIGFLEGLPAGPRAAILAEPLAQFHGVFVRKGRVWIWFHTATHRAPLLMRARLPFGLVEVILIQESYGRQPEGTPTGETTTPAGEKETGSSAPQI